MSYFEEPLEQIEKWVFSSRENANFTYDTGHSNKMTLASLTSLITKTDYETVWQHMMELDEDQNIRNTIVARAKSERFNCARQSFAPMAIFAGSANPAKQAVPPN